MAQLSLFKKNQLDISLDGSLSAGAQPDFVANDIVLKSGAATAILHCSTPITVRSYFRADNNSRLKTVAEIKADAEKFAADIAKAADEQAKELVRGALQKYEQAKSELRDSLRTRTIQVSQDTNVAQTFFGVRAVAGANVQAVVRIAADWLLDGQVPADGILLEALGSASININLGGQTTAASLSLSVRVTDKGIARMMPSFDLPQIAFKGLPKLDLGWAHALDFGNLDFNGRSADSFSKLFAFALPGLSGLGAPPFELQWKPAMPPKVNFSVASGLLTIATDAPADGALVLKVAGEPKVADLTNFSFSLQQNGALALTGVLAFAAQPHPKPLKLDFDDPAFPLVIHSIDPQANVTITMTGSYNFGTGMVTAPVTITAKLSWPKLQISARSDPRTFLTLDIGYDVTSNISDGSVSGRLSRLNVVEPYPVKLITATGQAAIDGIVRLFGMLDVTVSDPGVVNLIKRLGEFAAIIANWVAEGAAAVGSALIDAGEFLITAAAKIFDALKAMANSAGKYVILEIRLDASTWALRQIRVGFEGASSNALELNGLGLTLKVPGGWRPSLLVDLSESRPMFALLACPAAVTEAVVLSTDLWYSRPNAPSEQVRDSTKDSGKNPDSPLIVVTGTLDASVKALALIAYDAGKTSFFSKVFDSPVEETLTLDGVGGNVTISAVTKRPVLAQLVFGQAAPCDLKVAVALAANAKERLLPFLSGPSPQGSQSSGGGLIDSLGQYIKVGDGNPAITIKDSNAELDLPIEVGLGSLKAQSTIHFAVDIRTLKATISGDSTVVIKGPEVHGAKLLGLDASILSVEPLATPTTPFPQFALDFSHGGARLALLKDKARLELSFRRIASGGRGLVFKIDDFAIGKGGIDLEARADANVPVTLAGVEVPFRFTEGGVSIKSSRLNSFNITGKGQLPPALIGEANLTASLAMGMQDGNLTFKSASVVLDKGADPIVSRTTRFSLSLQKVQLDAWDFGNDGIHFWFLITGSARFTPGEGEFVDGLLKYLADLEIVFDHAPLTTNISVLKRHVRDFQIAVRMKKQINFFNLFKFELRSIGFHPEVERFGNKPALAISGQLNFADTGDTVSPKIDFHDLWIAPPKPGMALPQIAFDGLGVEMKLGGVKVEATAVTVDGTMPSLALDPMIHYPDGITMEGFLASGRLIVDGWAPIAGAMGFLEIGRLDGSRKHSFFVYGQVEQLSIPIPTPIGNLYLREVGFGLGFRYTFAGLVAADQVKSPQQLIQVLDEVSKRQGELASFKAWAPEIDGDRLTLAMRALFTIESATESNELTEAERFLPNPFMFDVAAALRSDLTFLMTVRVWLNTNYYSWVYGKLDESGKVTTAKEDIHTAPPLRGYLYLSAPRKTFLGRMVADGTGYLGEDPPLNAVLKSAMQGVTWSATMLIQPGLFHFEMGWPYELKIHFEQKTAITDMAIRMEGGMVFRIEDTSMLYGVAFRGAGHAQIGGRIGGDSFGASAVARAEFEIDGKFIAYIPVGNPKNTLFYGAISFTNTLSISIDVWLRIKIFGGSISFSLHLSFSQTISVALELAASPGALGGRGSATLSFSAFGRTARLPANFAFNTGQLEQARQQVERFLTIGLGVVTPDPEKGLQPPPAPAAPAQASQDVDNSVKVRDDLVKALEKVKARNIGQPSFWAVLFEIPLARRAKPDQREFVMQLIPRDHTGGFERDDTRGFEGIRILEDLPKATFYAPPPQPVDDDHPTVPTTKTVIDYRMDGIQTPPTNICSQNSNPHSPEYSANQNATIAAVDNTAGDSANNLTLYHLLHECFLAADKKDGSYVRRDDDHIFNGDLFEPEPIRIDPTPRRLPPDGAQATEVLRDAARRQLPLDPAPAANQGQPRLSDYSREVEERRSNVVTSIAESAAALAVGVATQKQTDGTIKYVWPERRTGVDARDFGLTFLVSETELTQLFSKPADENTPPQSTFTIKAREQKSAVSPNPGVGAPVWLLNPLDRFFARQNPTLAGASAFLTRNGIALDWDLEPPWSHSSGPYSDPEFLARYYVVRREVIGRDGTDPRFPAVEFQVKASAPERRTANGIERLRHAAHLVDTLDDIAAMDQELANALLQRGDDPFAAWSKMRDSDRPIQTLLYTVVPVDLAGSRGEPTPIAFGIEEPAKTVKPLAKAEVIFRYKSMPTEQAYAPGNFDLFLRIDDPLARDKDHLTESALPQNDRRYKLQFRREVAVPGGTFGVDALTQARARPTPNDFEQPLRPGDLEITVVMQRRETVLKDDADGVGRPFTAAERFQPLLIAPTVPPETPIRGTAYFRVAASSLNQLKTLLIGQAADLCGYRVAVQRTSTEAAPVAPSPWCPADLALLIHSDQNKPTNDALPVETMVEVFEHPRDITFNALDFDDLEGDAGRLELYHPNPDASLGDLIANGSNDAPIRRLVDPDRRTATRISWNSRPASSSAHPAAVGPTEYHKLIGGFDVFETDLAELARLRDLSDYARCVARVQRLPDDEFGLDPSEIVDFEKVEAHYPSEAQRYRTSEVLNRPEEQAPWFSTAETLLLWPRPVLRRFVSPAPPDADLAPLFDRGRPTRLDIKLVLPTFTLSDGSTFAERVKLVSEATEPTAEFYPSGHQNEPPYWTFERPRGWLPSGLSELLRNLRWVSIDAYHSARTCDDAYAEQPSQFSAVKLSIRATREESFVGEVSFAVNLNPSLHPFLADVLDRLRYDTPVGQAPYRRYTPVLDGAPPTKVKTLSDFMNERPADRDPYGWALLRTLGLATGIKLYDMERADYVSAALALPLVDKAFKDIAAVYLNDSPAGMFGQPFVEVMTKADGLHSLSSFDSGVPATTRKDAGDLIGDKGLSLVQIALRPVAEGLVTRPIFVGYVRVESRDAGPNAKLTLPVAGNGVSAVLLECVDISGGLSGSAPVLVGVGAATDLVAEGIKPLAEYRLANPGSGPAALIRVTVAGTADVASLIEAWTAATQNEPLRVIGVWKPAAAQLMDTPDDQTLGVLPQLFGRFAPLSGIVIDVMLFGTPNCPKHDQSVNSLRRLVNMANRKGLAEPMSEENDPNKIDPAKLNARRARLADLHAFTARFIAHGPAAAMKDNKVPFALASVIRHNPWRVAPSPDGVMDTLLVHEDSWARRRRYVVRPFGRYENLANAVAGAVVPADKSAPSEPAPTPDLHDIIATDETFAERSLDIVVPRTHPVLAPTFLSSQRLDVVDISNSDFDELKKGDPAIFNAAIEGGRRAGRKIEFVLARHPEEIQSEGNRQVADGYQFDALGLQFFREYASPAWARGLIDGGGAVWIGDSDLVPEFGTPQRPKPLPISFDGDSLDETRHSEGSVGGVEVLTHSYDGSLPQRIIDGWRGILSLRTADVPYFYRTHAVAHVAAGVVVSDAVGATVPEGRAIPRLPWVAPPWEATTAQTSVATRTPYWSVVLDATGTVVTVVVSLPLLRHIDAISQDEFKQWLSGIALPKVFRLPDATALYSIALEAGSEVTGARTVEADLMPLPPDQTTTPKRDKSSYAVTAAGPRFELPESLYVDGAKMPARLSPAWESPSMPVPAKNDGSGLWKADLPLLRKQSPAEAAPAPVQLDLSVAERATLATFEIAASPMPPDGWGLWTGIAKSVKAMFVATRPPGVNPADWIPFRDAVTPLHNQYKQLVPGSAAVSFLKLMIDCANAANPDAFWKAIPGAGTTYSKSVDGWVPGLPRKIGTSGSFITIMPPAADSPDWGLSLDEDQSGIGKRIDIADLLLTSTGVGDPEKRALVETIWRTMRGITLGRLKRASASSRAFEPLSQSLKDNAIQPIAGVVDNAALPRVFEMARELDITTVECPDPAFKKLQHLIDTIERQPTLNPDGLDPCQGIERTFIALDTLAITGGRGAMPTVTVLMGQNALDHYGALLTDFLAALSPPIAPNFKDPRTLTLRRPPSDIELSKLSALPGVTAAALTAVRGLAQDQTLGAGRRMTVRITRGFAVPVSGAIERLPS